MKNAAVWLPAWYEQTGLLASRRAHGKSVRTERLSVDDEPIPIAEPCVADRVATQGRDRRGKTAGSRQTRTRTRPRDNAAARSIAAVTQSKRERARIVLNESDQKNLIFINDLPSQKGKSPQNKVVF
ncbi:hypothetical protein E2553_34900 [Paraburkholderia dipogonis]|uniref:Uncharacterized protein n=1 Tax=Paraburkholderia dipogonis TaxID=1211383 RepID=A0A4Y8MWY6_9BURK|nr:hypothetical protein [Paraburkholderia dipogonis]TFE41833.1 hypothetical protein E2553_34900 [Paraburkholderia dipogonis]